MLYLERPCAVDSHLPHLTLTPSLTSQIANSFGRPLSQVTVCTIFSPLKPQLTDLTSFVRGNLPTVDVDVSQCAVSHGMTSALVHSRLHLQLSSVRVSQTKIVWCFYCSREKEGKRLIGFWWLNVLCYRWLLWRQFRWTCRQQTNTGKQWLWRELWYSSGCNWQLWRHWYQYRW